LDEDIVTSFSTFAFALSVSASAGSENASASQLVETGQTLDSLNVDTSSATTVTAIGRSLFDVFLAEI
jgi:hypothetical protein